MNSRGDHSFIGVFKPGENSVRYLDPSTDRDSNPAWNIDGSRIAFIRTLGVIRASGAGAHREEPTPWSIRIAEVSSGTGREVWHADKGPGSILHAMSATDQLYWTAGDRIAFAWEKTGWNHLYSISAEGGPATELTPGAFEIEDVSPSENRQDLLFSSNQEDIDRRHIWRVPVTGNRRPALILATQGDGIETSPEDAGGGAVAYFRASAREIGRASIKPATTPSRDLAPDSIPVDYPKDEQVAPQQVTIRSADGMTYAYSYGANQYWANKGYVVLSVNYRSGIARRSTTARLAPVNITT